LTRKGKSRPKRNGLGWGVIYNKPMRGEEKNGDQVQGWQEGTMMGGEKLWNPSSEMVTGGPYSGTGKPSYPIFGLKEKENEVGTSRQEKKAPWSGT